MRENVRTHVVCPKCKTMELEFAEVSEAYEKWTQTTEGIIVDNDEDAGALLGGVVRVEATCLNPDCGHKWTVRRAKDITDLPNWPKEKDEEEIEVIGPEETETDEEVTAEIAEVEEPAEEKEAAPTPKGKGRGKKGKKAA